MAKDTKKDTRKTAWRGISVKTDIRPTSPIMNTSDRASVSWERQPLSPLSQSEHNTNTKLTNTTPKCEEQSVQSYQNAEEQQIQQSSTPVSSTVAISPTNSTTVSSTKSSSKSSSKHRKEKLAGLGSLTKTPDMSSPSTSTTHKKKDSKTGRSLTLGSLTKSNDRVDKREQKERERKERKEMEKLARQERKDQEKLEKQRKEQQKKELKLAKEMERKERKSRTSSFLFSRSSRLSGPSPTTIDTVSNSTAEDKPKSPVERRSLLSFGRHSLASLTSKPSNASTTEIVTSDSPLEIPENTTTNDDSSSDEFVDFVDSQMSIHSDKSSELSISIPQNMTKTTAGHDSHSPISPPPNQQTELSLLQSQPHLHSTLSSVTNNEHESSINSTFSSRGKTSPSIPSINANHSMLYILNSLQDAGRNIGDDDLLDDQTANKMEKTQQQHIFPKSYHADDSHIQPLEISSIQPSVSSTTSSTISEPQPGLSRLLARTSHVQPPTQQHLSPSPTSPTISHRSSMSNSSYDTVSQADTLYSPSLQESQQQQRRSTGTSSLETTNKDEEEHMAAKTTPNSPIPGAIIAGVTKQLAGGGTVLINNDIETTKHSNTDDNGSESDKMNEEQQVESNEHQKESEHCSFGPKDILNTSSHLQANEISNQQQEVMSTGQSRQPSETHIAKQGRPIEVDDKLPPITNPSDNTDSAVRNYELAGGESKGDTHRNSTIATEVDENNTDDKAATIQHTKNDINGDLEEVAMETTPQPANHSNRDDGVTLSAAALGKDEPHLAEASPSSIHISGTKSDPGDIQMDTIGYETTITEVDGTHVATTMPSSSSPLVSSADSSTIQHTPSSIQSRPSSPMEAAAAVTASKRSTFSSKRWSATPLTHLSLEQPQKQRPTYTDIPTSPVFATNMSTTSLDINTTMESENGIVPNFLGPREQEEEDQSIRQGMNYLFGNKFTKAMSLFKSKAESEPLHALGLGSMLFLKAMMTYNEEDVNTAMDSLTHSYNIARTQADLSEEKQSFDDTFSLQFSSLIAETTDGDERPFVKKFKPNGVLRAHVIKAESCLLMGILQLGQENMTGYLKSGLNFKKACVGYNLVWKEYQDMGDQVLKWLDEDTISGIQFGVGTLHLLLSSLPEKIIKIFSGLAWKTDRALGLKLLNSVMTGKGSRSAFGSLVLLSYYSLLSSAVPSIYAQESIQPTIECLVMAQKSHPKSCFFLYYAARISRVARNVGLSTQSFTMATSSTRRGAWAEVAMKHTVAYEVGLNHAMQLDWDTSAAYFEQLCCARDWSPAFCQYFVGACLEMQGQRQQAINIFDEVPALSRQQHHRKSLLDNYVQNKVEKQQHQNYRDLDSSLPGLELLLLLNAFASMEDTYLQRCLVIVEETYEPIKLEGMYELDDHTEDDDSNGGDDKHGNTYTPVMTNYCTLLLLKSAVLNALSRYNESITHLEWVLRKKHLLENEGWLLPFVYYEIGMAHWGTGNQHKSHGSWQQALFCTKHDFEFRMASRIHLAMQKCDKLDINSSRKCTSNGRKRF